MKLRGIVLQTQRFRETDLIVNLLSEERGRLSSIARGGQKSKHRFPGGIDLWDSGFFELEPGRPKGSLSLESISERERWPRLREDLLRYTFAAFASELVLRLTEEEHAEDGALLRPLLKTFKYLSSSEDGGQQAAIAAYFSILALRQLGYDLAENDERFSERPELGEWIRGMSEAEQPILPHDPLVLQGGFGMICRNVEEILGRELRSKSAVEDALLRLRPPHT